MDLDGKLNLKKSLIKIKEMGFSRIFLESGIKLAKNFLKNNLVDDLKIFISNKKLGKYGRGSINQLSSYLKKKEKIL